MKRKTKAEIAENKETKERVKKFHNEILDKLENQNVISNMEKIRELRNAQNEYYYWVSPLWKAISKHIGYNKDCVLIDREAIMVSHRGHGPAIALKDTHLYAFDYSVKPPKPSDMYNITFTVEYFHDGEERCENPDTYQKSYYLNVPIDLELNFTKRKFDAWVNTIKEKRDAKTKTKELAQLNALKKKYNK